MELRYEKKLFTDAIYFDEFYSLIRTNNFGFREIYNKRVVNSIYFDNLDFDCFNDALDGSSTREKFRLRWYGNDKKVDSIFEIKQKFGSVGKKITLSIGEVDFRKKLVDLKISERIKSSFHLKKHIYNLEKLKPNVYINYVRRYFACPENKIRITLDKDISYAFINPNKNIYQNNSIKDKNMVIEFKYSKESQLKYLVESLQLPLCVSRFSKYGNALTTTLI